MNKKFCGGFVFAHFAIALPLLIFLGFGLVSVGMKIFELGKDQLADYVLEEEVHDVLSRIIYDARAAKKISIKDSFTLEIIYRTDLSDSDNIEVKSSGYYNTRVYGYRNGKIYYERQTEIFRNPITGNNYFGETEVVDFKFEPDKDYKNVWHFELEMESKVTGRKIKMSTAVFVPGLED